MNELSIGFCDGEMVYYQDIRSSLHDLFQAKRRESTRTNYRQITLLVQNMGQGFAEEPVLR